MCRAHDFDVTPGRVRHYLVEFGIHEPTPQGPSEDGEGPQYRDPEWLQERYQAAGGNVSEMHRRLDIDVPYRTLLKNLKRLGIHDPARSPEAPADPDEGGLGSDERDSEDGRDGTEQPVSRDADETTATAVDTDAGADTDEEPSHARSGAESQSREEHLAALGVDDPAAVDGFQDLATPEWLDEGSFYQGVEMAAHIDELAEVLGWPAPERLDLIIELLGLEDEVHRVRADGGTKYGHLISDEHWESDEDASQDEDPPRAEVRSQTVEVLWRSDPDLKYRVHISHGDHRWAPVASHARRAHRLAESNQFDPMGDVDWTDLPIPVRERVAEVIAGVDEREDLNPGCRIVNTEGFDRAV